jgi:hypothetical protein
MFSTAHAGGEQGWKSDHLEPLLFGRCTTGISGLRIRSGLACVGFSLPGILENNPHLALLPTLIYM